jgi:short-chain fatty acids transporter
LPFAFQMVLILATGFAVAAWLNWGLGLVVAAFLSREIARQTRVDFAWLVAGRLFRLVGLR